MEPDGPHISSRAKEMVEKHRKLRAEMMAKEQQKRFSYDIKLTPDEVKANEIIVKLRDQISNDEVLNRTIHNFYDNKAEMENSELFKVLNTMPKGAIHHLHTTAAITIDSYL